MPESSALTTDGAATMAVPQHLDALRRANTVRLSRGRLRRAVRERRLSLTAVLELEPLPAAGSVDYREQADAVPVHEILTWGHRIGDSVARRIMLNAGITPSPSLRLSHLNPRRRGELIESVRAMAPHAIAGAAEADSVAEVLAELETEAEQRAAA